MRIEIVAKGRSRHYSLDTGVPKMYNEGGIITDCPEEIQSTFGISEEELEAIRVIFALYCYESYEGTAYFLYEKDGKLYEWFGSHCSCNDVGEDFTFKDAEETSLPYLFCKAVGYNEGKNKMIDYGLEEYAKDCIDAIVRYTSE